jgi:hypothetical protein
MSLVEIEKQVRELPATERLQFVSWVYAHENELIEAPAEAITPELMEELLRRGRELDEGSVRTFTIEEATASSKTYWKPIGTQANQGQSR